MARPPNPENSIPLPFEEAVNRLIKADPKKLPPAVRPATPKAKKKRPARKKAERGRR
jgi:hypothetical protein